MIYGVFDIYPDNSPPILLKQGALKPLQHNVFHIIGILFGRIAGIKTQHINKTYARIETN